MQLNYALHASIANRAATIDKVSSGWAGTTAVLTFVLLLVLLFLLAILPFRRGDALVAGSGCGALAAGGAAPASRRSAVPMLLIRNA